MDFWLGMLVLWDCVIYILVAFCGFELCLGFITWLEFWLVCCVWVGRLVWMSLECGFGGDWFG